MITTNNDDWTSSVERALEVTEGQLALAETLKAKSIAVNVERARCLICAASQSKSLIAAATRTIERLQDLPRYFVANGMEAMASVVNDCLNELRTTSNHQDEGGRG